MKKLIVLLVVSVCLSSGCRWCGCKQPPTPILVAPIHTPPPPAVGERF